MVQQEIQNYVDQARRSGMSNEGIKQNLLNSGWPEADINQALGLPPDTPMQSPQQKEAENRVLMSVLSYFGPLVLVPYFSKESRADEFTKFHIKQGLVVFAASIVIFLLSIPLAATFLSLFVSLLGFGLMIVAIIGIINAATGKMKEIPVIGSFARKFKI